MWQQLRDAAAELAEFCALAALFSVLAIQRTLRPFDRLAAGLSQVGAGDYSARIVDGGSSELQPLAATIGGSAGRRHCRSYPHQGSVTAQMQRCVTSILRRLRPVRATEAGLRPAMSGQVAFWRDRNPHVDFDLRITADEAALNDRPARPVAVAGRAMHGCRHETHCKMTLPSLRVRPLLVIARPVTTLAPLFSSLLDLVSGPRNAEWLSAKLGSSR